MRDKCYSFIGEETDKNAWCSMYERRVNRNICEKCVHYCHYNSGDEDKCNDDILDTIEPWEW